MSDDTTTTPEVATPQTAEEIEAAKKAAEATAEEVKATEQPAA